MLAKRIIPCLDVKAGRVVKGVNFVNLIERKILQRPASHGVFITVVLNGLKAMIAALSTKTLNSKNNAEAKHARK